MFHILSMFLIYTY